MVSDAKQIGLTDAGDAAIQVLMADGRFATQMDAYRFAIAYAIGADLDLAQAPVSGYNTKYSAAGGLEEGNLRDLILGLGIGDPDRPYWTAEKLAEVGVIDIARRLQGNESLADLLGPGTYPA